MTIKQGQIVRLTSQPDHAYQLLSLDEASDRCWVRRWPLSRQGSPAFDVSLDHVMVIDRPAS